MSLYRVTWNGQDILDYTNERMVLLSPHHENELNMAGSLRFVVPTRHLYYDMFTPDSILISDVEIYEDGELIWFGRPIQIRKDFFNQKEIYCEGALGFFNDSIQEKHTPYECGVHEFFRQVLANHNFQVDVSRRILPGNITVDDKPVYREPNYEKTLDVLRGQCLETNDGYFFLRKENGAVYIDWLKDMPFACNQTIEFAENMLNVSSTFDGSDYATCVMPLGAQDDTGEPINIYNINNNNHILESEMAKVYGRIVQVVQFNDIGDPYELMAEGKKALERIQYNSHIIECSAADLHARDGSKEMFRVGQMVHCYSEPHELEIDLPLSKIELNLDTAAKNITLGIIPKKTLTRISKKKESQSQSIDSGSIIDPTYTDDSGIDWEIIMPTESGGVVTAYPMPTRIEIAREPNKTDYALGETLDFTGISVNIWTKNKYGQEVIWTNPPKYLDGKAPFAELSFSMKTAPSQEGTEGFSVIVTWTYKGKSYQTSLSLGISKDSSGEETYVFSSGNKITINSESISDTQEYEVTAGDGPFYIFGIKFIYTDPTSPHGHVTGGYIVSKNPFRGTGTHNSHSTSMSASLQTYQHNGTNYTAYVLGKLPYQEAFDPVTVNAPMNEITTTNPSSASINKIAVAIVYFNGTIGDEES